QTQDSYGLELHPGFFARPEHTDHTRGRACEPLRGNAARSTCPQGSEKLTVHDGAQLSILHRVEVDLVANADILRKIHRLESHPTGAVHDARTDAQKRLADLASGHVQTLRLINTAFRLLEKGGIQGVDRLGHVDAGPHIGIAKKHHHRPNP